MKHKWLIIPLLLTFFPVLVLPCAATEEFVSFDFLYSGPDIISVTERVGLIKSLIDSGYTTSNFLSGVVARTSNNRSWNQISAEGSLIYFYYPSGANNNLTYLSFSSRDENLCRNLQDNGLGSYVTVQSRFVLDYFPTDVLSYFFYRFFENNYILWSIGIWILAIAFKMIFSTSGVLRCTRGF